MNWITKMRRIKYFTNRNQIIVEKSKFGKFNHDNNVIHDAHRFICIINPQKFGDFGKFGDIGPAISPPLYIVLQSRLLSTLFSSSPLNFDFLWKKIFESFEKMKKNCGRIDFLKTLLSVFFWWFSLHHQNSKFKARSCKHF